MGHPLRFNTGDVSVDARLLRLEALASQPSRTMADGLVLEEWIDRVLAEMRGLPHDVLRRLKPESLYSWDSPRKWDPLRIGSWHARVSADLRQRLAGLIDPSRAGTAAPADISSSMGVTHSYRHYLREGLEAVYGNEAAALPEAMLEQVARMAAAQGETARADADAPAPVG
ncbi:MAG TPA: hypothetical protein VHL98_14935 [Microvirga sp.]|jgi:hypothetical protein|nr:hypothetical protein [Microvirga sp.]